MYNVLRRGLSRRSSTTKRKTDMVEGAQKIITNRQIDERSLPVGAHSEPGWTWAKGIEGQFEGSRCPNPETNTLPHSPRDGKHRVSFNANGYGGSQ
ncbi:hypothetical protein CC1G_00896 [Coprinopsis cinerea okayama7|uniref:Uncharacterized protein n=1 Tax=Coprinopsis cinerea (strain Okayama-7 / 130 / ATCC MYA-4618 / FGSC 9003) TaxID=240176 RepID=A8N921_COPC7|nr:hypothetical protein CC1G_00896 [Coprinopsis cinerea okayama7\|eukprot:XP_001831349.2 hypothetical protein CC1G_00896 [Coprinopsis cinerea okayama7\